MARLLSNLVHHQIDMICGLLEACGRFLFRSPDTHRRTKIYLDIMNRKKQAMHMDQRYSQMIEDAFYTCNPPDRPCTVSFSLISYCCNLFKFRQVIHSNIQYNV